MLSRQHVPRPRGTRSQGTDYDSFGGDRQGNPRNPLGGRQDRYVYGLAGGGRHYNNPEGRYGLPDESLFSRRRGLMGGLGGIGGSVGLGGLASLGGIRRTGPLGGSLRGMGGYMDSLDGYAFGDYDLPLEGLGGYSFRTGRRMGLPLGRTSLGTSPLLDPRIPRRRDRLFDDLEDGVFLSPYASRDSLLHGRGLAAPELGLGSRSSRAGSVRSIRGRRDIDLIRLDRGYGNYRSPYVEDYESVIDELERERLFDDIEFGGLMELRGGYSSPESTDDYFGDGLDYLRALGY